MEISVYKWVYAFSLACFLLFSQSFSFEKVRGVNLGGWLVVEGWMKPSLFDGIPNGDMLYGAQIQFKSVTLQRFISAENGGGSSVSVNRTSASGWETFRLWRLPEDKFQLRSFGGQFLSCVGHGCTLSATAESPSATETFYIERNANGRAHIRLSSGAYLQATTSNQIVANSSDKPGWDDNMATFEITINNALRGDYQLGHGFGHDKAKQVLKAHRRSFVTAKDFRFLSKLGINTVRIPVGWWIALDPKPPAPFVGGSLAALDNAFSWAKAYGLKCIIDLHAAPGSQNGMEHSASKDGFVEWPKPENIAQSLQTIDFLARRYAKHPSLLGIELLNEPLASAAPLDVVVSYYSKGYKIVRKYSSTAYVIMSQSLGSDPIELFQANIGSSYTVVDLHPYNLFSSMFDNMTVAENIDYVYNTRRAQIQRYTNANGPLVFIGEWVNEIAMRGASQADYQNYGKAQLDVFGAASFGWAYWSLKCELQHWDFKWNVNNQYLLLGNSTSK